MTDGRDPAGRSSTTSHTPKLGVDPGDAPQEEALERYEPAPYVPPAPIAAAILALTVAVSGWFAFEGATDAAVGRERLARTLLEVTPRNSAPVDFELTTLDGERVRLSDLRGKTVFLNFWATWCPPCVEEMPSLRRLYERLSGHPDFVFLAVSTDEEWAAVRRFFEREPAPFSVLLDPKGEIARRYGTTKFPETYVIRDGEVLGHIIGPRDWDHWYAEAWLREVLDRS